MKSQTKLDTLKGIPPACCTMAIDGEEKLALIEMFKALGNPIRFGIVQFLVTHPGCITGDIVSVLPLAQATVSQHLKVLRDSGWVQGEVEGPAICYELNAKKIAWFRDQITRIL